MSSGDSGLARARCGPFTGSCGRTRALRATWRESVARVTLRWSAEPARLPKNRLEGRVARARARDATRSRAPGRAKSRNPLDARGGLTHRHARTSRVRGASRGRVLWTGVAFRDAIERARPGYRRRGPRPGPRARAPRIVEPRGASLGSSRTGDTAHRSSRRPRRDDRRTARRHGRVSRSAGARPINNERASAGTKARKSGGGAIAVAFTNFHDCVYV